MARVALVSVSLWALPSLPAAKPTPSLFAILLVVGVLLDVHLIDILYWFTSSLFSLRAKRVYGLAEEGPDQTDQSVVVVCAFLQLS